MNLLLDSHALFWALHTPDMLKENARQAIEDSANSVLYSAGAVWELELKLAKGKLVLRDDWLLAAAEAGFAELPITGADAAASAHLPRAHADPFDRLFIAQAMRRRFKLATRDSFAAAYAVDLFPV